MMRSTLSTFTKHTMGRVRRRTSTKRRSITLVVRSFRHRCLFRAAYCRLIRLIFQQLNFAGWPQFCDHSVTSADVRLSVGLEGKHLVFETVLRTACFDTDTL